MRPFVIALAGAQLLRAVPQQFAGITHRERWGREQRAGKRDDERPHARLLSSGASDW